MKRIINTLCLAITAMLFTGCVGYNSGSIMHPDIKTIAIAPIKNNTFEPLASTVLRNRLAESFMIDSSLKLADPTDADCIIYAIVDEVEVDAASFNTTADEREYRTDEWRLKFKARFSVIVPGKVRALIPERTVQESTNYFVNVDEHAARRNALNAAGHKLASKIVQYTVEAW